MLTIECLNRIKEINSKKLAGVVYNKLNQKDKLKIELCFVSESRIKQLNGCFLSRDKITDVLSFPALCGIKGKVIYSKDFPYDTNADTGEIFLGSVAVCKARAQKQAKEFGHSFEREINYLTVHGILHLFGYDHESETDKAEMRELEEKIIEKTLNT